jgi:pimeloyl-ACP methyl ester carboxylesterase
MEEFAVKKVKTGKAGINYAVYGKGKPIVLVHGWTNNWMGWIPLARSLGKRYRLYMIDLPGFGDSDPLPKYDLKIEARYVSLFIKAMRLKPEAVIGLSMGSMVVAKFGKDYPDLTKKIIIIGGVFKSGRKAIAARIIRRFLKFSSGKKIAESTIKKIVDTKISLYVSSKYINMYKFNKSLADRYGLIGRRKLTKEAYVQMGVSIAETKLEEILEGYKLPALLLFGEKDRICNISQARRSLKNLRGNFTFSEVCDAGHVVTVEKPDECKEIITSFLIKGKKSRLK